MLVVERRRREEEEEEGADTGPKTKTPHDNVGKNRIKIKTLAEATWRVS